MAETLTVLDDEDRPWSYDKLAMLGDTTTGYDVFIERVTPPVEVLDGCCWYRMTVMSPQGSEIERVESQVLRTDGTGSHLIPLP